MNAQNAIECLNISDDDQFQEVSPGRSAAPSAYLKKGSSEMEKFTKCFLSTRSLFWEMLLLNFRRKLASQ